MAQWKKLLFNHDVTDVGEEGIPSDVWRFSTGKAITWSLVILSLSIIFYGLLFVGDSDAFFRQVLLCVIILAVAAVAVLLVARVTMGARRAISKFFLLFIVVVFTYGVLSTLFSWVGLYSFHMGLSTWVALTVLAGYGATRAYIFNGNLDRHDIFYCLLVFVIMAGGNWPISGGEGVLEHIDGVLSMVLRYAGMIPSIGDGIPDGNITGWIVWPVVS